MHSKNLGTPQTRNRSTEDKESVRQSMIEAAAELFAEHGYERFSLRKVAERAGFSAGNLYLYFANKDDLLYRSVEVGFTRFGHAIDTAAPKSSDPIDKIKALGRAYIQFGLDNPSLYRLMFMLRTDFLYADRPFPSEFKLLVLEDAVRDAVSAGELKCANIGALTDTLWALVHGVVSLALDKKMMTEHRRNEMIEQAMAFVDAHREHSS